MQKPNIVFILADDMGNWSMRNSGNTDAITPNLDMLAQDGMKFESFFCASPVCSPARASILAGVMPSCHGVHDWIRSGNLDKTRKDIKGIPRYYEQKTALNYMDGLTCYTDILADNGYDCRLSGKWHLGDSMQPQHGFRSWYTIGMGGCHYMHPDIVESGQVKLKKEYITDLITENALQNINEFSESEPFYLSVHYTAPHSPWTKDNFPNKYWDMYEGKDFTCTPNVPMHECAVARTSCYDNNRVDSLRGFYTAITSMDDGIGQIMRALKVKGIYENTIIIFTADNGMNMGHHGIWGKGNGTFPMNMYEESINVPFIMTHTNNIKSSINDGIHSHYDILPTLVDYLGFESVTAQKLCGNSFAPELNGQKAVDDEFIVSYSEFGSTRMIRNKHFKYIERVAGQYDELYDLECDGGEENNLIANNEYRSIAISLKEKLDKWFGENSIEKMDGRVHKVQGLGQIGLNTWKKKAYKLSRYKWQAPKRAKKLLKNGIVL